MKEEIHIVKKNEAIEEQLIGFICNKIISKGGEFYNYGRKLPTSLEYKEENIENSESKKYLVVHMLFVTLGEALLYPTSNL